MATLSLSLLFAPISEHLAQYGVEPSAVPLTAQEAASGILGSISVAAWVFVIIPQVIENYRASSATAISLPFLLIWFLGDILNFAGAAWAGLVPTAVALSAYFCVSDVLIISQCAYYNIRDWREARAKNEQELEGTENQHTNATSEHEPLLERQRVKPRGESSGSRTSNIGMPGSHIPFGEEERRHSFNRRRSSNAVDDRPDLGPRPVSAHSSLSKIDEGERSKTTESLSSTQSNIRSLFMKFIWIGVICIVGTAGWAICYKIGVWKPTPDPSDSSHAMIKSSSTANIGAAILGYISAALYLGARIPQMIKNWTEKSCEGLSSYFFLLSLIGNLTYGAGIIAHSQQRQYLITNTPWLIGSLGTIAEDITIFVQFHMYGNGDAAADAEAGNSNNEVNTT